MYLLVKYARKLKYQTDKLLKIASACTSYCHIGDEDYKTSEKEEEGEEGDENPLSFMPRPEVMSQFGQGADFSGVFSEFHGNIIETRFILYMVLFVFISFAKV